MAEAASPRRAHALILLLCLLAGGGLRLVGLGSVPLCLDELHYAADSILPLESDSLAAIRDVNCLGHRLEGRARHGALQPALIFWAHRLLGAEPSPATMRLLPALAGIASIALIFLAARALWGTPEGLLAAALLATLPWHVRFSRTAYLDSLFTLWILAAVWAWVRAWRSGRWTWATLAGLFTGLALAMKVSGPLLILWLALAAIANRKRLAQEPRRALRIAIPALVCAAAAFTLLCEPLAYLQAAAHPDTERYASRGLLGLGMNALHEAPWIAETFLALALGLLLVLPVSAWAMIRAPRGGDVTALMAVFAWLPLVALHVPPVSGEHGWLPLMAMLCLVASRAIGLADMRIGRLAVAVGLSLDALLAVAFGMWIWSFPWGAHFNYRRAETEDWRALWRAQAEIGSPGVVLTTIPVDITSMRNLNLLFPSAVIVARAENLMAQNPADLTWCDALILEPEALSAWSQDQPRLEAAWSVEPFGHLDLLLQRGRGRLLRPGDFTVEPVGPVLLLRPRLEFYRCSADLEILHENLATMAPLTEEDRQMMRAHPLRPGETVIWLIPWPGWESEAEFRLKPPPRIRVYDEHLIAASQRGD